MAVTTTVSAIISGRVRTPAQVVPKNFEQIAKVFFRGVPRPLVLTRDICFRAVLCSLDRGELSQSDQRINLARGILNSADQTLYQVACINGLIGSVEQLLGDNRSLLHNLYPNHPQRGLYDAALGGRLRLVRLFFEKGYEININRQMPDNGKTPLHAAIDGRHPEIVKELLVRGADLGIQIEYEGFSLGIISYTIAVGAVSCFDALVEGKDFDCRSVYVEGIGNLLHIAVHYRQRAMLQHLLNVHRRSTLPLLNAHQNAGNEGFTPLSLAASVDDRDALYLLIRAGASLEKKDRDGNKAVHAAAQSDQVGTLEVLVSKGSNLTEANDQDKNPLRLASDSTTQSRIHSLLGQQETLHRNSRQLLLDQIETISFSGGGAHAVAFGGIITALEERHLLEQAGGFIGSSMGTVVACFLAMGLSGYEVREWFENTYFLAITDNPLTSTKLLQLLADCERKHSLDHTHKKYNPVAAIKALDSINYNGACSKEELRTQLEAVICARTGISECTLADFRSLVDSRPAEWKHLTFDLIQLGGCGAAGEEELVRKLRTDEPSLQVILSTKGPEHILDSVPLVDLIMASVAIPYAFVPQILSVKDTSDRKFVALACANIHGLENLREERKTSLHIALEDPILPVFDLEGDVDMQRLVEQMMGIWRISTHSRTARNSPQLQDILVQPREVRDLPPEIRADLSSILIEGAAVRVREYLAEYAVSPFSYMPYPSVLPTRMVGVPPPNPHFIDRPFALRQIEEQLFVERVKQVSLQGGKRGGKTELVKEFVHRYAANYSLVLWIDETNLHSSLVQALKGGFAKKIGGAVTTKQLITELRSELKHYYRAKPVLIVSKGSQHSSLWVHADKVQVLEIAVSSATQCDRVVVETWAPSEIEEMFAQIRPGEKNIDISNLPHSPDFISLALAYLRETPECSLKAFCELFSRGSDPLVTLIQQILQPLVERDPDLKCLLILATEFDCRSIPIRWLELWFRENRRITATNLAKHVVHDILEKLHTFQLICWEPGETTFSILFHDEIRGLFEDSEMIREGLELLLHPLILKEFDTLDPLSWDKGVEWTKHLQRIMELGAGNLVEGPGRLRIIRHLNSIFIRQGDFDEASRYIDRIEQFFPEDEKNAFFTRWVDWYSIRVTLVTEIQNLEFFFQALSEQPKSNLDELATNVRNRLIRFTANVDFSTLEQDPNSAKAQLISEIEECVDGILVRIEELMSLQMITEGLISKKVRRDPKNILRDCLRFAHKKRDVLVNATKFFVSIKKQIRTSKMDLKRRAALLRNLYDLRDILHKQSFIEVGQVIKGLILAEQSPEVTQILRGEMLRNFLEISRIHRVYQKDFNFSLDFFALFLADLYRFLPPSEECNEVVRAENFLCSYLLDLKEFHPKSRNILDGDLSETIHPVLRAERCYLNGIFVFHHFMQKHFSTSQIHTLNREQQRLLRGPLDRLQEPLRGAAYFLSTSQFSHHPLRAKIYFTLGQQQLEIGNLLTNKNKRPFLESALEYLEKAEEILAETACLGLDPFKFDLYCILGHLHSSLASVHEIVDTGRDDAYKISIGYYQKAVDIDIESTEASQQGSPRTISSQLLYHVEEQRARGLMMLSRYDEARQALGRAMDRLNAISVTQCERKTTEALSDFCGATIAHAEGNTRLAKKLYKQSFKTFKLHAPDDRFLPEVTQVIKLRHGKLWFFLCFLGLVVEIVVATVQKCEVM